MWWVASQALNPDSMGTPRLSRLSWNSIRMGNLPSTWFRVHPTTYGPTQSYSSVSELTWYFKPTMWEPSGSPLGKIRARQLVHAHSWCSASKGGNSIRGASNFSCFRITYISRPTQEWSNTIIQARGNVGVVFLSFFSSYLMTVIIISSHGSYIYISKCTNILLKFFVCRSFSSWFFPF